MGTPVTREADPHIDGYQKLAYLMGAEPKYAIFRRFGWLSTFNLMKLQAQLAHDEELIREALKRVDAQERPLQELGLDQRAWNRRMGQEGAQTAEFVNSHRASTSFEFLFRPPQRDEDERSPRLVLCELLRESEVRLGIYNELLLQTSKVSGLGPPAKENLEFLHEWLKHNRGGESFLNGTEGRATWHRSLDTDMIALMQEDIASEELSGFFQPWIVRFYDSVSRQIPAEWARRRREEKLLDEEKKAGEVYDFSKSKLLRRGKGYFIAVLTLVISLLPSLVILGLSRVSSTDARIGITIAATAILGIGMKVFTTAKLKEVLAITLAFAAVEVVFIGSAAETPTKFAVTSPTNASLGVAVNDDTAIPLSGTPTQTLLLVSPLDATATG